MLTFLSRTTLAFAIFASGMTMSGCRGNLQSEATDVSPMEANVLALAPVLDSNTEALTAFNPASGDKMSLRVMGDENLCLDVKGASTEPGASVIASLCHDGDNQKWRLVNGQMRVYDALCLAAGNGNNAGGFDIKTAACSALENGQKWTLGGHKLQTQTSGLCVTGNPNTSGVSSSLILVNCEGSGATTQWLPQQALAANEYVQPAPPSFSAPLAVYTPPTVPAAVASTSIETPAPAAASIPVAVAPTRPAPFHIKGPVQPLTIALFNNFDFPGGWGFNQIQKVTLPSADVLARFDTMDVTLDLRCPRGGACGPWDFVASLSACGTPTAATPPGACANEIARWVTPYGVPGSWTTRISDMLALIREGGTQYFAFSTPQAYQISINLTLSSVNSGYVPVKASPLYSGGDLNANFNSGHVGKTISLEFTPDMARIFTLGTGHGWGTTAENCAEFCNLTQEFLVNNSGISYDGGPAIYDPAEGCQKRAGVVQNQAGTFQYGRNGWCPGADVVPNILYVTGSLRSGANDFAFRVLRNNASYVPNFLAKPSANGINPTLNLTSYLVEWRQAHID